MFRLKSPRWHIFAVMLFVAPSLEAAEPDNIGTELKFAFDSLWLEECSKLGLIAKGAHRTFIFYKPDVRERAAATSNPVLFVTFNAAMALSVAVGRAGLTSTDV